MFQSNRKIFEMLIIIENKNSNAYTLFLFRAYYWHALENLFLM